MICPKCGKKMIYIERDYAPDTFDCECGEWIEVSIAFNELKARAEKAEGELKAIKARIEVIAKFSKTIVMPYKSELIHNILELQKQIGGEK